MTKYHFFMNLPQISHTHKSYIFKSIIGTFWTNCFYPINFMALARQEYIFGCLLYRTCHCHLITQYWNIPWLLSTWELGYILFSKYKYWYNYLIVWYSILSSRISKVQGIESIAISYSADRGDIVILHETGKSRIKTI